MLRIGVYGGLGGLTRARHFLQLPEPLSFRRGYGEECFRGKGPQACAIEGPKSLSGFPAVSAGWPVLRMPSNYRMSGTGGAALSGRIPCSRGSVAISIPRAYGRKPILQ